ncbi:Uncharacterized protein Rs2_00771 [Raphanus sativus]|nr:Uncharacterized protein Rs2_00771 [Raphanus sativus]
MIDSESEILARVTRRVKLPIISQWDQSWIRDSYLSCCRQFYTLPELIEYMTTRYPGQVTAKQVTDVFREMLRSQNAEKYLRASQHHSRVRQMERERLASTSVSTPPASTPPASTPPASDAASTSTSVSTPPASDAASTSTSVSTPPASDAATTSTAPPQNDGASSSSP